MTRLSLRAGSIVSAAILACVGALGPVAASLQSSDWNRPIAHIQHNGLSFSVSVDRQDDKALLIIAPAKDGTQAVPIRVKLRLRDESVVEGAAERQPSVGSGGYVDWRYRFHAGRPLTISDIFSVTISLRDHTFELYLW